MNVATGIAAGFFAGAAYRGYRIGKEHEALDAGWNGGWTLVSIINLVCAVLAAALLMEALVRPPEEVAP